MADRPLRPYPPVGDPDRFDEIVRRGSSLRRRRRLATGAGAGGALAVLAIGAVVAIGIGGDDGADVVADQDDVAPVVETTTTAPALPAEMTVTLEREGDTVLARVVDPAQPEVDDAQQCVVVVASAGGTEVASGFTCNGVPGDGPRTAVPLDPIDPEVRISDCAPQVTRIDPSEVTPSGTRPATTVFEVRLGDLDVAADSVSVEAVSGRGDGCAGTASESTEIEAVASAAIEVPPT